MSVLPLLQEINDLIRQSANWDFLKSSRHRLSIWAEKVSEVVPKVLGRDHHLAHELEKVRDFYSVFDLGNLGYDESYYVEGVARIKSVLDQTAKELEAHAGVVVVNESSIDPDLWGHVRNAVENEDWSNVAASVVVFVEDKIRELSGMDRSSFGKDLFAKALGETGPLMLGAQGNEQVGWRGIGMGLVQAVGNVDRHHIQQRDDVRTYALGVLGLGSLILTQVKFRYPEYQSFGAQLMKILES